MRAWYVAMQENHRMLWQILLTYNHLQGNAALIGKGDCIRPKKTVRKQEESIKKPMKRRAPMEEGYSKPMAPNRL